MCGICGIYSYKRKKKIEKNVLDKMTDAMSHRGPDNKGLWIENNIGFGHRRLSIIDLSEDANQPMKSNDGRYIIVYNGEIYNFQKIKKELIDLGHKFNTNSDTEVILNLFIEKKHETPKYLNGIFAFAIWDIVKKELFIWSQ